MIKRLFFFTLIIMGIAGCSAGPIPQNAEEYRQGILMGGFASKHETFVVARPYSKVSRILAAKSKECLNAKLIKRTCYNKTSCTDRNVTYTPTVIKKKNKTEIHVQWRRLPWDYQIKNSEVPPPEAGMYITVMDAEPAGAGKTKITMYGPSLDHLQTVPSALRHWAKGTNLGCPDLTQPYYY